MGNGKILSEWGWQWFWLRFQIALKFRWLWRTIKRTSTENKLKTGCFRRTWKLPSTTFRTYELVHEKEKFKAISDELDQTFAEMSGYWENAASFHYYNGPTTSLLLYNFSEAFFLPSVYNVPKSPTTFISFGYGSRLHTKSQTPPALIMTPPTMRLFNSAPPLITLIKSLWIAIESQLVEADLQRNLTSVITLFRFKKYLFEINFYTHKMDLKFKTRSTVEMLLKKVKERLIVWNEKLAFSNVKDASFCVVNKSVPTVDLILNQFKAVPLTLFRTTRKINPMKWTRWTKWM